MTIRVPTRPGCRKTRFCVGVVNYYCMILMPTTIIGFDISFESKTRLVVQVLHVERGAKIG